MLFAPRVGLAPLAALCRRLAMATASGIDARTIWTREAQRSGGRMGHALRRVRDRVAAGEGVGDALAEAGGYFPPLMREMVAVGDQTGSLAEVLRRLADHYEYQLRIRRSFLASLVWPMTQLGVAILVVAVIIWFNGFLSARGGARRGEALDLLGFGLAGGQGLAIYAGVLAVAFVAVAATVAAVRRGAFWTRPLQRATLQLPGIGGCLRTLALSRIAWTLHLTLNVAMDVRQALRLALMHARNDHFSRHADSVASDLSAGCEIHEALRRTGAFPAEFLHALEVAEHSGQMVESLGRLSAQYEEQAQTAISTLATLAGFAIWAAVAAIIVALIFRLAGFYFGRLQDAARGVF